MSSDPEMVLRPLRQAKVMRLRVDTRTGAIVLTYPYRMSRQRALRWAADQRGWIDATLAALPPSIVLEPGAIIPVNGEPHRINWAEGGTRIIRQQDAELQVGGPREMVEPRVLRWLKARARDVLGLETREFAAKAGVFVTRIGVGDARSRWGSCSSAGAIRYSWRLILAPAWVRRATVAHEVAHRVYMNHGPAFHALVRSLLGEDPKPARLWLKANGAALHRIRVPGDSSGHPRR